VKVFFTITGRYGGFRDRIGYDEVDAIPGDVVNTDAGAEMKKQMGNLFYKYANLL
jgi:hypothetical protein